MLAYIDMPENELGDALQKSVENGIMTGYEDGTIRAYNYITRAEMAVMITRCFDAEEQADISAFTDISEQDWCYETMSRAVAMGAFSGDGDKLMPDDNITFQEVFTIIAKVFSMEEEDTDVLDKYSDSEDIADWAEGYTAMIVARGYWGKDTEKLRPLENITRGEFAQLMNNIISVYVDEPGVFVNETGGNIMVRAEDVTINDPNGCELIVTGDGVNGLTVINNCDNLKYLVVRGGEVYPVGTVFSIRLAMPGTVLNAAEVKVDHGGGVEGTTVNFGDKNLG